MFVFHIRWRNLGVLGYFMIFWNGNELNARGRDLYHSTRTSTFGSVINCWMVLCRSWREAGGAKKL